MNVQSFVDLLTSGSFQAEADINQDGVVTLLDVDPFVALLVGGQTMECENTVKRVIVDPGTTIDQMRQLRSTCIGGFTVATRHKPNWQRWINWCNWTGMRNSAESLRISIQTIDSPGAWRRFWHYDVALPWCQPFRAGEAEYYPP